MKINCVRKEKCILSYIDSVYSVNINNLQKREKIRRVSEEMLKNALNYHYKNRANLKIGEKDPLLKWVFGSNWRLLTDKQIKNYYKLMTKRLKKALNDFMKGDNGDDDNKFLRQIIERFEDVISHIMDNKKLYLLFMGLISTCIYIYKNRKALNKSLNEAVQEIEKKCADFERFINNK